MIDDEYARRGAGTWASVLIGVFVALLVLAAGAYVAATRTQQWTASANLLVLPQASTPTAGPEVVAGFYDVLSRGQVPETYAELLRGGAVTDEVARRLKLTAEQRQAIAVSVEVVPDTTMIAIRATAIDPTLATRVSTELARAGAAYIASLRSSYTARLVPTDTSARPAGPGRRLIAVVALVVALVAGIAAQQLVQQLVPLLRRRSRPMVEANQSTHVHARDHASRQRSADDLFAAELARSQRGASATDE